MATFSGPTQIAPSDSWTNSLTDIGLVLGQICVTPDGRTFKYGKAGASNLAIGKLNQSSALVAGNTTTNITVGTNTAGTNQITATPGTTVTANQYAGGFIAVNAGTGLGQMLQISSHPAITGAVAGVFTTVADDALQITTSVSDSKGVLYAAPYNGVIVMPITQTGTITGVNPVAITASQYGFFQTQGLASVLSDVSVAAIGLGIAPSTTTAGAVTVVAATTNEIGYAAQLGVSAEYRLAYLTML